MMRKTMVLVFLLGAGCAAPVGSETAEELILDDPLASDGKADGDPWCSLEHMAVGATIHTVEVPANVCHQGSKLIRVGENVSDDLPHDVARASGGIRIGCTTWTGDVDINAPVRAEADVYRVPVDEGQRVFATLEDDLAVIDLLIKEPLTESMSKMTFVEHGTELDITADGGDTHVHEKGGERFIVFRVRPRRLCPNAESVEYQLEVLDGPPQG